MHAAFSPWHSVPDIFFASMEIAECCQCDKLGAYCSNNSMKGILCMGVGVTAYKTRGRKNSIYATLSTKLLTQSNQLSKREPTGPCRPRRYPRQFAPSNTVVVSILMVFASSAVANIITSSDIRNIASNTDEINLAEATIAKMLEVLLELDIPPHVSSPILAKFRSSIILKQFQKSKQLSGQSFNEIASNAFMELAAMSSKVVENPWNPKGKGKKGNRKGKGAGKGKAPDHGLDDNRSSSASESHANQSAGAVMYEHGKAVGIHMQLVEQKGFHEKCLLKYKKDHGEPLIQISSARIRM